MHSITALEKLYNPHALNSLPVGRILFLTPKHGDDGATKTITGFVSPFSCPQQLVAGVVFGIKREQSVGTLSCKSERGSMKARVGEGVAGGEVRQEKTGWRSLDGHSLLTVCFPQPSWEYVGSDNSRAVNG